MVVIEILIGAGVLVSIVCGTILFFYLLQKDEKRENKK